MAPSTVNSAQIFSQCSGCSLKKSAIASSSIERMERPGTTRHRKFCRYSALHAGTAGCTPSGTALGTVLGIALTQQGERSFAGGKRLLSYARGHRGQGA